MKHITDIVMSILESGKQSAETQLQLNKVCEIEDAFTKNFSKEKLREYIDLDNEKGQLHSLEIDHVVEITFKICNELFLK